MAYGDDYRLPTVMNGGKEIRRADELLDQRGMPGRGDALEGIVTTLANRDLGFNRNYMRGLEKSRNPSSVTPEESWILQELMKGQANPISQMPDQRTGGLYGGSRADALPLPEYDSQVPGFPNLRVANPDDQENYPYPRMKPYSVRR